MIKVRKVISIFLGLSFIFAGVAFATETKSYLDDLRFAELQLSAITGDMYLYIGWEMEEKEAMKAAAGKAIADLDDLKGHLMTPDIPNDLVSLKNRLLKVIEQLAAIYEGIEKKSADKLKKEFLSFDESHAEYVRQFKEVWKKSYSTIEVGQNLNPLAEELPWISSEQTRKRYQEVAGYLKAKNYTEAYKSLKEMAALNEGEITSDLIKLRLSDVMLMMGNEAPTSEGMGPAEQGLKLLTEILEGDQYSPILYEAFYKWRTTEQQLNHGMSNFSEIPNSEYNDKRWEVIKRIKKYLAKNPSNNWAKTQLALLWDLSNIQRGGPYGNDNLMHWEILYSDLE